MKVIVDLCVVPIGMGGVGVHLAPYIAACEKVLTEAGLTIQLHPNGTAIEGEREPVFQPIEACHQAVHAMGCQRSGAVVTQGLPDQAGEVLPGRLWWGQKLSSSPRWLSEIVELRITQVARSQCSVSSSPPRPPASSATPMRANRSLLSGLRFTTSTVLPPSLRRRIT